MEKIVVTRHKSLVKYLRNKNMITNKTKVFSYVKKIDILDKHVIGKLPYFMSCHAAKYTEVQLRTPEDRKGKELTLEEIEFYLVAIRTYIIRETEF